MSDLLLATSNGLVVCDQHAASWQVGAHSLQGLRLTSVSARSGVILAGTTNGIWRSEDGGHHWQDASTGLTIRRVRWLAFHPDSSDRVLAGTEPAGIFVSQDGGALWRLCPEVIGLRDEFKWSLPYSPEAGCIRGFAFHGDRLYAAAEVGGVLRSDDAGETWRLAKGSDGNPRFGVPAPSFVHPDVHSVAVHPSTPDAVLAPTGGGFFRSSDGGATWEFLYDCYCRAVWADPTDPQHMILGPADDVDRRGRIEVTQDGGTTWAPASVGVKVPWPRTMAERFAQVGDELIAVLSNGELYASTLSHLEWRRILPEVQGVAAVAEFSR